MTIETELGTIAELADLRAENQRLRAALARYRSALEHIDQTPCDGVACDQPHNEIAREALREEIEK